MPKIPAFHHLVAVLSVFRDDGVTGIPGVRWLRVEPVQVTCALPDGPEHPGARCVIVAAPVPQDDHAGSRPDLRTPPGRLLIRRTAVVISGAELRSAVISSMPSVKAKLRTRENSELIAFASCSVKPANAATDEETSAISMISGLDG